MLMEEEDEERQEADELLQDLKNAEPGVFARGTTVSCPDGYIFSVEKFSCAELLNLRDIELDFEENSKQEIVSYHPLDGICKSQE